MTNIDFSFLSPFGLSFLWVTTTIQWSYDLQFLLTFLDVLLFFCFCFSLLQKYPGVFLFWLSLFSIVFVFCNCLYLVWFSGVASVAAFWAKSTLSFLERFSMREFIILSFGFSCSYRISIWSCSLENYPVGVIDRFVWVR